MSSKSTISVDCLECVTTGERCYTQRSCECATCVEFAERMQSIARRVRTNDGYTIRVGPYMVTVAGTVIPKSYRDVVTVLATAGMVNEVEYTYIVESNELHLADYINPVGVRWLLQRHGIDSAHDANHIITLIP